MRAIRVALALITVAVVSCSLVVETDPLNAGCPTGTKLCNGECVDFTQPEVGCRQQGCLACFLPGAVPVCSDSGECVIGVCHTNFINCDNLSNNGCETDKRQDNNHCGECNNRCEVDNGLPDCAAGRCAILDCNNGFANCDDDAQTGCEINIRQGDNEHCGACNTPCTGPQTCQGPAGAKTCQL